MRTAIFSTEFWEDDVIDELSRDEKLFYIMVVTNPKRNTSRVFKCTNTSLRKVMGYEVGELKELQKAMSEKGLLFFFKDWIIIGDSGYVKPNRGKKSYTIELAEIKKIPSEIIDFYDELLLNGSITVIERISISNKYKVISNNIIYDEDGEIEDYSETEEVGESQKPHDVKNDSPNSQDEQSIANEEKTSMDVENGRQALSTKSRQVVKTEKQPKKAFSKPTVEEITEYCKERNNGVNPQKFFDYYEVRNWKPKGSTTQMVNWKAAVRTWEGNNFDKPNQMQNVLKSENGNAKKISDRVIR